MRRILARPAARLLLAGLLLTAATGCGGDDAGDDPPADRGWRFTGIWGTGADDLITVGFDADRARPFVHRRTGGVWLTEWLDVDDLVAEYRAIFGADKRPEFILWPVGGAATNLHAAGDKGVVYRFDGSAWQLVFADLRLADWRGLWSDDEVVLVAGSFGNLLRGTADGFTVQRPFGDASPDLYDVWGAHADNCWVVGERVARFVGTGWTTSVLPQPSVFLCVHGRAWNDVYIGSLQGDIYRFDGTAWALDHSHAGAITDLFVFADGTVAALSPRADGTDLLLRTGDGWSVAPLADVQLEVLWGTGPADIHAAGGRGTAGALYRWDGAWTRVETAPSAPAPAAAGIVRP